MTARVVLSGTGERGQSRQRPSGLRAICGIREIAGGFWQAHGLAGPLALKAGW